MRIVPLRGAQFRAARRFARIVGVLPVVLGLMGRTSGAQQPVVLVHGFFSDGSTWLQTAQRLQQEYNVTTSRPNLTASATFENQSSSLISQAAGLPSNTIAIGHSNGGLVSREANEDGRPWRGIVTIGTLHTGAPLALSVLQGRVFEQARYVMNSVIQPFIYYSYFYPDEWAWQIAGRLGHFAWSVGAALPTAIAGIGFGLTNPVLPQMVPGSSFLNRINSTANLNREAAALTRRVSISSTVPTSYGMVFQSFAPDNYQQYGTYQYFAGAVFLSIGLYYQEFVGYDDPWYFDKRANAFLWFQAAAAMFNLDHNWCYLIGAYDFTEGCLQNDGVVPTSRMPYVGGTRDVHIVGPAHLQATRDGYDAIADVLGFDFGVTPPAGDPFTSVSVTGPSWVNGCEGGVWTANPTGGAPPITYAWTVEGYSANTGTGTQLYYTNIGSAPSIFVQATATDSRGVVVSSSNFKSNVSIPGSC